MYRRLAVLSLVIASIALVPSHALATEWFVATGGSGPGTAESPFGRIQQALAAASAGDVITLRSGTYAERFTTVRAGNAAARIVLRASGPRGSVVLTAPGRVATIDHPFFTVENLVLDGQYGADDTVRIGSGAHYLTLRNLEVRRSARDLIDMGGPHDVVIEDCLIHRALNAADGRTDAHGVVAGPVRNLTLRRSEIHTFSGDGLQMDPGRSAPGWDNVTLEDSQVWLAPLKVAENGFAAGTVVGENAVDTKASAAFPRARLTIRNVSAWGFKNGLISNMAAFNLKEFIDATLDGVTVHDSEIAFRLRGAGTASTGATVRIQNAVVYRVTSGYRYEDEIRNLRIFNSTIGVDVVRPFQPASSAASGLEVRNLLVVGARPAEASHPSNLSVASDSFVSPAVDDYRLSMRSPAIDRGTAINGLNADRAGTRRPQGQGIDIGAYEWVPGRQPSDSGNE